MKTRLPILISLFAALLGLPFAGHADDIDIYAGLGGAANAPNLMFVIDTAANNDANFGTCYYDKNTFGDQLGGSPSNGSDTLGNNQCAMYNVAKFLPTRPVTDPTTGVTTQVAMMKLGITSSDGLYFPLTPMDDNAYTGPTTLKIGGGTVSITATTNRTAFLQAVTLLQKHTSLVDYGDMMQETWAYYTGGDGTFSNAAIGTINTAVGMISGTTFSGTSATTGCQRNYVVFIGATSSSSHVNDAGNTWNELYASVYNYENGLVTAGLISQTLANSNITSLTTLLVTSLQPDKYVYNPNGTASTTPKSWAREWAKFMYTDDVNSSGAGTQNIVTYSISIGSGGNNVNVDQDNFLNDMANVGGGKYFNVSSYSDLYNAILKILNEVQAVNSVFSSSSLPVSVNAQGTYLNQIFMGMFRPDAEANPRWMGNLKQYQFIYDPTTATLHLGDSLGNLALSSSGTGFISPNAVSFWTCANLSSTPYADSYLTNNVTSSQVTLMKNDAQNCSLDPTKGFWASDPSAATALAQGFDVPDGERVERGGAAQRIRNFNLTDDYTQAAGSSANPRNIYTYCPSGSGCVANLTDASNVFAPSNSGITASMFGTTVTNNISSITRSGGTVTVTTTGEHGFNVGDQVTIANANISNYDGTFAVTSVPSLTTFTYTITESPPASATGSYVSVDNAQITFYNLSSLAITSRAIATDGTVTATVTGTPTAATGFVAGNTVTIQNVTPSNYDGTYTMQSASSTSPYAFTYNITETPPAAAGGSTATSAVATGFTNASCKASSSMSVNIGIINTATPSSSGVYRNPNSSPTTVTFTTTSSISTWRASCGITVSGVVDSYGSPVTAYNGAFTTTGNSLAIGGSGNTFTITLAAVTPTSPATNVTGLTMQAGAASMLPVTLSLTDIANANPPAATVTATTGSANTYAAGDTVSIGDKPGVTTNPPSEAPYKGNFTILSTPAPTSTTFAYQINTLPANPSALAGTTMTASRSTGFNSVDMTNLINWVRGMDNMGDEASLCPGGALNILANKDYSNCPSPAVTVRPSVSGDVLHSRPTVLNYGAHTITITSTSDSNGVRTAIASTTDVANIANSDTTPVVTFANLQMCPVTVASSTTFTYSATGCGNAGAQTAFVGSKIVVFYGDNGGIFHAVNGEQLASQYGVGPGQEIWGFIPQETFYLKLARLRNNSPQLDLPSTPPGISPTPTGKDYFVDGTPGVYQAIDANGNTVRAVLYLSMRRGGHFIYAIDVTNPTTPTVLWKMDATGLTTPGGGHTSISAYSELGQTWSQPKVAWVRGYTTSTDPLTGRAVPVVLFGGGYAKNEDNEPEVAADSQGRAIFAVDALTGALVWEATTSGGGATSCGTGSSATCQVNGMNYSIAADLTLVDRNSDGYIDRIYAADVGGNIWRVDLEPGCNNNYPCSTADPTHWNVTQFAALGCDSGACTSNPVNPTQRKFFYPPEIIPASTAANFDAIIAGSGDREHPLSVYLSNSTQRNALFLLEDTAIGDTANTTTLTMTGTYPLDNCTNQTACVLANGTTTTSSWGQLTAANQYNGYYISLGAGEKVVNAPLAVAGIVYVSTNTPPASNSNSCTNSLGTAIGYQLSPYSGITTHIVFDGGGLPPSPVAGVVNVVVGGQVKAVPFIIGGGNPNCVGPDCTSALGGQKPNIAVPTTRTRNYWYVKGK